jgi:CHASE3 domain sensor protein
MKVRSRLTLLALGTIVVVAVVGATSTLSISKLASAHRSATHTREILQKLDYLMFRVTDATASQRAFLITGQKQLYEAYRLAETEADQTLEDMRVLVASNPKQIERIDKLARALKERWEALTRSVETARKEGREAGLEDMRSIDWVTIRKEWTNYAQEIRTEEDRNLQDRDDQVEDGTFIAHMTALCGTIFAAVFVGFSNFLFGNHIASCVRKLLRASDNIEKGRFDTVVTITSTDEFSDLADAYTTLGQKLSATSDETNRNRQKIDQLHEQVTNARNHLTRLAQSVEEDSATLLEQTALKTDEWGEHSQMLISSLKNSSNEVLHRVSAMQEKLEFSTRGTVDLCSELEKLHEIQALLDEVTTQLEVFSVAATMELARTEKPSPSIVALMEKFGSICESVRKEKIDVQKMLARMQVLASKALLSTQDTATSVAGTKLSCTLLMDSIKGFPDMEAASNEMMDDLIASVRTQAHKLMQGKERMREIIREIDRPPVESQLELNVH